MISLARKQRLRVTLHCSIFAFCIVVALFALRSNGFVLASRRIIRRHTTNIAVHPPHLLSLQSDSNLCIKRNDDSDRDVTLLDLHQSRRKLLISTISIATGMIATSWSRDLSYAAGDTAFPSTGTDATPTKTIWLTGKDPIIPGKKPRDKNDITGTKKDPNFLRSISDCKSQCERTSGPDGFARTKDECLSDCQDICCTTYQQCTFGIVNRI
jgi:hypothetical protein